MRGIALAAAVSVLAAAPVAAQPAPAELDGYGGSMLKSPDDDTAIWWKVAGPKTGPAVIFLHGGPGANSFAFEHTAGKRLEKKLRMIYFDQRGGGRSPPVTASTPLGMKALVADVERIRAALNVPKVGLIAHGFGGMIALEYLNAHPENVTAIVFVECTADVGGAMAHQLDALVKSARSAFPDKQDQLATLESPDATEPVSVRLAKAYGIVGKQAAERALLYGTKENQDRAIELSLESGLEGRGAAEMTSALQAEGFLDGKRDDLMVTLRVPGAVFGGRRSQVLGPALLQDAANAWRVPLLWFDRAGHDVFSDEPDLFAARVFAILAR